MEDKESYIQEEYDNNFRCLFYCCQGSLFIDGELSASIFCYLIVKNRSEQFSDERN